MAKTAQDLVTAVLENLTHLEPGEEPNAEDSEFVTRRWKSINDNLRVTKVSTWPYNSIPDQVFEPLVDYVTEVLWQKYKGSRQGNAGFIRDALGPVIAAVALPYAGSTLAADYY